MLTKKLFFLPLLGLVGCMVGPDFQMTTGAMVLGVMPLLIAPQENI